MEQTAIKAGPPTTLPTTGITAAVRPSPRPSEKHWARRAVEVAASLRVTVVLFTLAMFLVFFGTWAQKDAGIWTVVSQYFHAWITWVPIKVLLMYSVEVGGSIPFPGGWVIGGLLLVNLLAAHAIRFKLSWNRAGIFMIHGGLILMMLGELIYGVWGVEGHMSIAEGNVSNFVEHERVAELAFVDRSDPKKDREIVIPGSMLVRGGTIQHPLLPFDVEVVQYMGNSALGSVHPKQPNPATAGIGLRKLASAKTETAGTDTEQRVELPSAYVTLKDKQTGKALGTYLVSTYFCFLQRPLDEVKAPDGKTYGVGLRFEREYRDFYLELLEFRHDKYMGTEIAKNFSSKVRLVNPDSKEDWQTDIYMNHPLRYSGEAYFQARVHPLTKGTVLQVVRNPGWTLPYLSCLVVTLGMMVHFGMNLISFLQRRAA